MLKLILHVKNHHNILIHHYHVLGNYISLLHLSTNVYEISFLHYHFNTKHSNQSITCRNSTIYLYTKCHNTTKKCHKVIKKRHAMTFRGCEIDKKLQPESAGYVKVKLIAGPLTCCQLPVHIRGAVTNSQQNSLFPHKHCQTTKPCIIVQQYK